MGIRKDLRNNITEESVAYGYTLSVWGSGALLLNSFQTTPVDILSFIFGSVLGFALLSLIAFKGLVKEAKVNREEDFVVASMIHILASLGTVVLNYLIVTSSADVNQNIIYLTVGLNTTFIYNLMLMAESYLSKDIFEAEKRLSEN